ncbi:hypothetical protein DFH11DRAFT_1551246 [Phellopilus nigrolimitatus]|nr:hypothetical protein DFH11DRAFT_1551246 [Phellopilus nigrolimitatus]
MGNWHGELKESEIERKAKLIGNQTGESEGNKSAEQIRGKRSEGKANWWKFERKMGNAAPHENRTKWGKEAERKGINEELEEWSEERNIRKLNDNRKGGVQNRKSQGTEKDTETKGDQGTEKRGIGDIGVRFEPGRSAGKGIGLAELFGIKVRGVRSAVRSRWETTEAGKGSNRRMDWAEGFWWGSYLDSGSRGRGPNLRSKNGDDRESLRSRFDQRRTRECGESPDRRRKRNHKLQIGREGDGRRARALSGRSPVGSKSVQRFRTEPSRSTSSRFVRIDKRSQDRLTHRESAGRPPKGREAVKKLQKQERLQEEDFNNQAKSGVRSREDWFGRRRTKPNEEGSGRTEEIPAGRRMTKPNEEGSGRTEGIPAERRRAEPNGEDSGRRKGVPAGRRGVTKGIQAVRVRRNDGREV